MGIIAGMDASSGAPGRRVNDARRLVRDAARPLPARARAGVVRPDRRRHLRVPRDPDRPAGVPVPRAEPDRRALDRRSASRPRRSSPIRTGCRSRRTRSTSSCCRTRSNSRAIRTSCCARSTARSGPRGRSSSPASIRSACSAPSATSAAAQTPPWNGSFIALYRLKDWLALLGFEVTGGGLDCYVPPFASEKWRARCGFFEAAGDRWWPIARRRVLPARDEEGARHAHHHAGVGAPQERTRHGAAAGAPVHRAVDARANARPSVATRRASRRTTGIDARERRGRNDRYRPIYTDGACKGNPGAGRLGRAARLGRPREGALRRRARRRPTTGWS